MKITEFVIVIMMGSVTMEIVENCERRLFK